MKVWKQLVLAIIVLGAAAVAWFFVFPGARDVLARIGVEVPGVIPAPPANSGPAASRANRAPQGEVIVAPVTRAVVNDRLQAIGTGQANASVAVNPFDSGRLVEVSVAPGARIEVGAVLAHLDSEVQEIALDRAKLAVEDAQNKLDRTRQLRNARAATDVQLADARVAVSVAKLAQRDAEIALDRRTIRSPISGVVGILPIEAGDYVTSQTAIATVDDRSQIKIDFWVPERFASQIAIGQAVAVASAARPGNVIEGSITAIDNRLDQISRTIQVQASIPNRDDLLRAGMSFQVDIRFAGDAYPAVEPLAIQWGAGGAFVWQVKDGKAVRTPVRIIQRSAESVLVDADLAEGQMVVTQGMHLVREGGDVRIAQRTGATASPVFSQGG
jgi:RND family efflux transporter MFP subunit